MVKKIYKRKNMTALFPKKTCFAAVLSEFLSSCSPMNISSPDVISMLDSNLFTFDD